MKKLYTPPLLFVFVILSVMMLCVSYLFKFPV